ncbi:transporter substrate-binding domain-containing protein [Bradyrhizobium sp. dw_411]|uniref:transporter substrate-binding domain-containing protein n=1 Tax=Bradyrhizobium sp. dw_411 TaxID=2720082 RepID=UPI00201BAC0F|nr:transporter substrate-binding domain-containing protein [Bradyrhizobium sp. dw_411]
MMGLSLRAGFAALAFAFLAGGGALQAQSTDPAAGKALAPSGHLRVGVYAGSPTSEVTDPETKEKHGVTYDLGKEFAARLNVPVEYVNFPRVADVIDAIKDGKVDFTVTNATPVRAKDINFSKMLLMVELGYLVPANSPIARPEQIDGPGIRIGVSKGGTSERVLAEKYRNAKIISTESVPDAINSLRDGVFDVYATNKSILFQMARSLPGARVLDGNWGAEHMAIAVPKGRETAQGLLDNFVRDVQSSGRLQQIETTAGLKGAVNAQKD